MWEPCFLQKYVLILQACARNTARLSDAVDHGAALFHEIGKSSRVPCQGGLYFAHLKVHSRWYSGLSVTSFLGVQYFEVVKSVILIRHGTLHVACHPVSNGVGGGGMWVSRNNT